MAWTPTATLASTNFPDGHLVSAADMALILANLDYLKTRPYGSVTVTSSPTTTNTSYVDITGMTTTYTGQGGNVLMMLSARVSNSGANLTRFDFTIGGTRQGDISNGLSAVTTPSGNAPDVIAIWFLTTVPPAAGSNTYAVQWSVSAGTSTLTTPARFFVWEIL